jgi:hypothetical protein
MPTSDGDSGGRTRSQGIEIRPPTAIFDDERGIEGLPIRLVIALLVGVAALSVMMTMIEDVGGIGKSELDAEVDDNDIDLSHDGSPDLTVTVVDEGGDPVSGATVTLAGSSAQLADGSRTAETESDGEVTFDEVTPELEPNQDQGTLTIDIHPPNGDFQDEQENTEILVHGG